MLAIDLDGSDSEDGDKMIEQKKFREDED